MKRLYIVCTVYIVCFLGYLMHEYDNPYTYLSGRDVVSLIDRTAWCMMFFPVWAFGVWVHDMNWNQAELSVYRHHSILKWWNKTAVKLILFILHSYLILCLGVVLASSADLTYGRMQILGKILLHALGLLLVGLFLSFFIRDTIYVGAALVLTELSIGASVNAINWHGFMILVEAMLFVSLFFLFPNSRKGLLIRKLAYEKNG